MARCVCRSLFTAPLLFALAGGLALFASLANAGDGREPVEVQLKSKVHQGHSPVFIVVVNQAVATLQLELRTKGQIFSKLKTHLDAGRRLEFELPHTHVGTRAWRGELSVQFEDGSTGKLPVAFSTEVVGTLTFEVPTETLNLKENKLVAKMSRPAGRVDVEVTGVSGALLANVAKEFHGEAPGTPLEVSWMPRQDEEILRIKVVVHDTEGFFSPTLELYPYSTVIQHEEVVFPSGQSTITPSEEKKLLSVIDEVKKRSSQTTRVLKQTGSNGKAVRLFIVGHTDTVGPKARNQRLSEERARAIGKWFAAHGVTVGIFTRGYGETQLAVATPDNTDEVRNRRVDYVLAIDSPTGSLKGWARVR